MNTPTDSPETDEFERSTCEGNESSLDFARKLEREKNEWRQHAQREADMRLKLMGERDDQRLKVERERDRWKDLATRMRPYIEPDVWEESSQIQHTLDEFDSGSQ